MPNTFILGDSPVRVKTLRKSVTSSYKVNKEFRFKVFCIVFILCVCVRACVCVCVCVLSCVSSEKSERKSHPCVCFWLFSSFSSPLHIMHICITHEYICLKKERFHSSDGALLVH